MNSTRKMVFFCVLLCIWLSGCQVIGGSVTPIGTPTPTATARWRMYEKALAKSIVSTEKALCEWAMLGEDEGKVYVYALCKVEDPIGSAGSVPAVIYLGEDREIVKVVLPRGGISYGSDLRAMFPDGVYEKVRSIETDATGGFTSEEHLDVRLKNGGPPLVVEAGTPMP